MDTVSVYDAVSSFAIHPHDKGPKIDTTLAPSFECNTSIRMQLATHALKETLKNH